MNPKPPLPSLTPTSPSAPPVAMSPVAAFDALWRGAEPVLVLAPMQDVTDLPFLRLMAARGGVDLYFTEYFRVHTTAQLDRRV